MSSRVTRKRLLDAAYRILSEESLSQLSIDHVSEVAGLSRRTFFLHFTSKDQLLAELIDYLRPAQAAQYAQWAEEIGPGLAAEQRVLAIVRRIADTVTAPGWRGSCFLRISAEFGERPGHPAHAAVAAAQQDMQHWLESELARGPYAEPALLARQLLIIIKGLMITQLVQRDGAGADAALRMASRLLAANHAPA